MLKVTEGKVDEMFTLITEMGVEKVRKMLQEGGGFAWLTDEFLLVYAPLEPEVVEVAAASASASASGAASAGETSWTLGGAIELTSTANIVMTGLCVAAGVYAGRKIFFYRMEEAIKQAREDYTLELEKRYEVLFSRVAQGKAVPTYDQTTVPARNIMRNEGKGDAAERLEASERRRAAPPAPASQGCCCA